MENYSLDIVIPIYNEEEIIDELCNRLMKVCESLKQTKWRVLFINDGSTDRTTDLLRAQHTDNKRFTIVELSRNFGHQASISAGVTYCDADAVILMDGDLQDPPELIPELLKEWKKGSEIVLAVRQDRQERGFRRIGFDLFHNYYGIISDFKIPKNTGTFCLLERRTIEYLKTLKERNRFLPGLRAWIGFQQSTVIYNRANRFAGKPKQTIFKLFRFAFDAVFSFSYKPLRLLTYIGSIVSSIGFFLATIFIIKRLVGIETAQTGFTTLVTLILFLGGFHLIAIGILGEYIGRIYDEVKLRPLYVVRKKYGIEEQTEKCKEDI